MSRETDDIFTLTPGNSFASAIGEGQSVSFVSAAEGDYVSGVLETAGAPLSLHVLELDGCPWRRLVDQGEGLHRFSFIARGPLLLEVTGAIGSAFTLSLTRVACLPARIVQHDIVDRPHLSPRLRQLADELASEGDMSQVEARFWDDIRELGTPLVEVNDGATVVTFLYKGARCSVEIVGAPGDEEFMQRLRGTDIWFRSYIVPPGTRCSYQFAADTPAVPDGAPEARRAWTTTASADPFCRLSWPEDAPDIWSMSSVFHLDDAPHQPGYRARYDTVPDITDLRAPSAVLENDRRVLLYRSRHFDALDPDAVLMFCFDGPVAVRKWKAANALDDLVSRNELPPIAVAFIDPIDSVHRNRELPDNADFARFMASELLPQICTELGLQPNPQRTVLAGASYGALASTTIALRYPSLFGNVISMSGSYWWAPPGTAQAEKKAALPWIIQQVLEERAGLPRFLFTAGTFENSAFGPYDIRESSRLLHGVLTARGAESRFQQYSGGHDGIVWRGALTDALLELFGTSAEPRVTRYP